MTKLAATGKIVCRIFPNESTCAIKHITADSAMNPDFPDEVVQKK